VAQLLFFSAHPRFSSLPPLSWAVGHSVSPASPSSPSWAARRAWPSNRAPGPPRALPGPPGHPRALPAVAAHSRAPQLAPCASPPSRPGLLASSARSACSVAGAPQRSCRTPSGHLAIGRPSIPHPRPKNCPRSRPAHYHVALLQRPAVEVAYHNSFPWPHLPGVLHHVAAAATSSLWPAKDPLRVLHVRQASSSSQGEIPPTPSSLPSVDHPHAQTRVCLCRCADVLRRYVLCCALVCFVSLVHRAPGTASSKPSPAQPACTASVPVGEAPACGSGRPDPCRRGLVVRPRPGAISY
jgi:hypothetical protein